MDSTKLYCWLAGNKCKQRAQRPRINKKKLHTTQNLRLTNLSTLSFAEYILQNVQCTKVSKQNFALAVLQVAPMLIYEGRPINKLQNGIIQLIFKI